VVTLLKLITSLFLLFIFVISSYAQQTNFQKDLYGIRLKQYREVPTEVFGKPFKSGKFDDGFEYEYFQLKPDRSVYMVFEYSAEIKDLIWSIQLTGSDPNIDLGFQNLRFGLDKSEIEKQFAKPAKIVEIGEFGESWEFTDSNFSFEFKGGKLSSVKIRDDLNAEPGVPDIKKLPQTLNVLRILTSEKNEEISKLLAPDMEIYAGKKTLFFGKPLKTEIANDFSKIFITIKELSNDLKTISSKNTDEIEENGRLSFGQGIRHVIKFKKGHKIREIVFKYEWGEFLIWEIKAE
jgi:hypothetical protein